jgi:tRNA threonylcarbamoyladenosine biosynthesis protein TsaB
LLTLARAVCEDQKMALSQLDGIGVSIGPGSFTGLRIGLSTAKGLCYALSKTLIAVPTFEALAAGVFKSHPECVRVAVCVDAKQGEYYFGMYERRSGTLCEVLPVQIKSLSVALSAIPVKTIIVTDRRDEVKNASGDTSVVEDVLSYCHGDMIAGIAIEKMKAGVKNILENLEPMYLKDFVIQTHKKSVQLM